MIKNEDILYDIKVIEHHLKIGYPNHYNLFTIGLRKYITEQEKKDKLLELYRELHDTYRYPTWKSEKDVQCVLKQIKELDEALK